MDIPKALKYLAGNLQNRKAANSDPYRLFLTCHLSEHLTGKGFRALARLICGGYFSTILTSNTNTALEDALKEQGSPAFNVFVVGRNTDEQIASALEGLEDGIHIVKLYNHEAQGRQTSSPLKPLSHEMQTSLQRYFNREIIIVGCIDQEEDAMSALRSHKEKGIYYVLPDISAPADIIVEILQEQHKQAEDFLVTGDYGDFNTFFSTLEKVVKDKERIGREDSNEKSGYSQAFLPASRKVAPAKNVASSLSLPDKSLSQTDTIKVFYVYSSAEEDMKLQQEIEKHLSVLRTQRFISEWHKGKIDPGTELKIEIEEHFKKAQVILLLISADFISSDNDYITQAVEKHKAGNAVIIPIILRPCDWERAAFGGLAALPDDKRPITSWPNRDEALMNVVRGVRKVIERLKAEGLPPFER